MKCWAFPDPFGACADSTPGVDSTIEVALYNVRLTFSSCWPSRFIELGLRFNPWTKTEPLFLHRTQQFRDSPCKNKTVHCKTHRMSTTMQDSEQAILRAPRNHKPKIQADIYTKPLGLAQGIPPLKDSRKKFHGHYFVEGSLSSTCRLASGSWGMKEQQQPLVFML